MITRRSRAREVALQLLFQKDQNPFAVPRKAINTFAHDRLHGDAELTGYCLGLYDGVLARQPEIDPKLTAAAENWRLTRMTPVDRNVLRLGVFELLFDPTRLPLEVAIDEAIELSRRFGSKDSPAFVNGVLDKISKLRNAEFGPKNASPPEPPPADGGPAPARAS